MSYLWFGLSLTILLTAGSVLLALLLAEERYIIELINLMEGKEDE